MLVNWLQKQWQVPTLWQIVLIPLSWLFGLISHLRRSLYKTGSLKSFRLAVPVIVVGNINVGGTGKTPLVIWLAEQLLLAGFKPGIISRGYGGNVKCVTEVFVTSNPAEVGDEPVLIAKRTNCPMFVHANRVLAGEVLLKMHPECDVIISDDGLQHYRLQRDFEIALVSSSTLSKCQLNLLPAGSMREKVTRLQAVDAIVDSGTGSALDFHDYASLPTVFNMHMQGDTFESLDGSQAKQTAHHFMGKTIIAIAGIGNPQRFFQQLASLGLQFKQKIFADHHAFTAQDLAQFAGNTILMTDKDAVKCQSFGTTDAWYLPVVAVVTNAENNSLVELILNKLRI